MRLRLVPSSGLPIYRQIVEQVAEQIACGRLRVGDRLPSVRELARALPANQNTVLKAYELLERDGLIARRHGDGTFVARDAATVSATERRRVLEDLLAQAASKAQLYGIDSRELHRLLDQEIARLSQERGDFADAGRHESEVPAKPREGKAPTEPRLGAGAAARQEPRPPDSGVGRHRAPAAGAAGQEPGPPCPDGGPGVREASEREGRHE